MMEQPLADLTPEERMPLRWWPQAAALLLVVLELGWVVPWHQAVSGLEGAQPPSKVWAVMGIVMLAAYALALAGETLRLLQLARLVLQGALLGISLLAGVTLLQSAPLIDSDATGILRFDLGFLATVGFILWVWQRGVALGSQTVRPPLAWRRFQIGLAALVLHTFAATFWRLPTVGLAGLTLYLFTGLLAVTLARISYVSLTRSARKSPFDRRWVVATVGVLGAAVSLAALGSALLTGQGQSLLDGLRALLGYLTAAVLFVLSLPALLLSYLLLPLAPLLEQWTARPQPTPLATQQFGAPYPFAIEEPQVLGGLPLALQTACMWLALGLVVVLVFLSVRRRIGQQGFLIVEGPESLLSEGDAARLARQAFQDFLDGLARRLRPAGRLAAAQRVRQIYAALLDLSAALDCPRPSFATPWEFLPALSGAFPGCDADLQAITRMYVRVRYGQYPEDPHEIQAVEAAWARLQAFGERRKASLHRAGG